MVYLKKLEIQGFKSFADKVELEFNPGITIVVGPNGSGKSNVVDAIRWVLGEQSAKTLRGSRMDDIIFSGSDGRKAVSLAYVSLTIDNSMGIFPLEFNEITVTRKLYRSGESEYLINKVPCRMRDIHELFMDTGVGREGFSVIGQGKIDEILSLKAEDRRNLVEEAAGIVKYRYRKKEAERKLEETRQSLLRISDIIMELKGQLGPLKEQAQRAEKYQQWKEEADQWEISLILYNIDESKKKLSATSQKIERFVDQLASDNTYYHSLQSEIELLRSQTQAVEQKASQLQQDYYQKNDDLQKIEQKKELALERKGYYHAQLAKLEKEHAGLTVAEEQLLEQSNDLLDQTKKNDDQDQLLKEKIGSLNQDLNKKKNLLAQKEIIIGDQKANLIEILRMVAQNNNEIMYLESNYSYSQKNYRELDQRILEIKELLQSKKQELSINQKKEDNLQQIKLKKEQIFTDLEKNLDQEEDQLQQTKLLLEQQRESFQQMLSRLHILKEMEESGEGYQKGVRAIFDEQKRNNIFGQGIIGVVADILKVPKHLETAIEIALGGSLQFIVAENDQIAQKAIEFLKTSKKGRATFLPLNTISFKPNNFFLEGKGIIGRASDLIKFEPRYQKVIEFLLGRIWIVDNLKNAVALGKSNGFNLRMVTLNGELIAPGGTLTGGSMAKNRQGFLARKRIIAELQKSTLLIQHELTEKQNMIAKIGAETDKIKFAMTQLKEELYQLKIEITQAQNYQIQMETELKRLTTEEEIVRLEQQGLKEQEKILEKKKEKLDLQLWELEENHDRTQLIIEQMENAKKEIIFVQQELSEKLNQVKIEEATLDQIIKNNQSRYADLDERLKKIRLERIGVKAEQDNLDQEIISLDSLSVECNQRIIEHNILLNNLTEDLTKVRLEKSNLTEETLEREQSIKLLTAKIEKADEQKHLEELKEAQLKGELSKHVDKLQERFKLTFVEALSLKKEMQTIKKVEKRIADLRNLIEDLGLVNFTAIEEFKRVSQRLDFLELQIKDLNEAQDTLIIVINETDQVMAKKFQETFRLVNKAFSKVFAQLFDGGKAFLELTDSNDLLETGLEIIAQPPGKKLQNLLLLSGGERAMTAIALLLAILEIKPSPFCVLDEIESSLDAANAIKFAQYLRSFAQETQFIIITHRKDTMEIGDYLYGVTMENSGVSKLISVRLNKAI